MKQLCHCGFKSPLVGRGKKSCQALKNFEARQLRKAVGRALGRRGRVSSGRWPREEEATLGLKMVRVASGNSLKDLSLTLKEEDRRLASWVARPNLPGTAKEERPLACPLWTARFTPLVGFQIDSCQRLLCQVEAYPPGDPLLTFTPVSNHSLCLLATTVSSVSEIESAIPHNVEGETSKQLFNYQPRA